jgi:hypothetical protein
MFGLTLRPFSLLQNKTPQVFIQYVAGWDPRPSLISAFEYRKRSCPEKIERRFVACPARILDTTFTTLFRLRPYLPVCLSVNRNVYVFNVRGSEHRTNILIYIQQDAKLHSYFIWKLLYMFQVVPPPIIRRANNSIYSIWYLSYRYCYLPLSWKSWNAVPTLPRWRQVAITV